jgi:hypothetical protein
MRTIITSCLEEASAAEGVLGAALMDTETGSLLGSLELEVTPGLALDQVAELCVELIASKRKRLERLGLNDEIEDIALSFDEHIYLIKISKNHPNLAWILILAQEDSDITLASLMLDIASKRLALQLGALSEDGGLPDSIER